jgi:hypothetical protein
MRRGIAAALSTLAGFAAFTPGAAADFHLVSITEVAPNPSGAQSSFIELQMYAPGQTQLMGHTVSVFDADGGLALTTFGIANAAQGQNQRTYLIGDDLTPGPPDFVNQQLAVPLAPLGPGGAVCFDSIDCVAWGNFTGVGLPSPPGAPAPAIPDGSSLTRSIAPGCATLLEGSDDTNSSAADFAVTAPSPRNNATAPTEVACAAGGGVDNSAPQTTISKQPKAKSTRRKAKFEFESNEDGSSFMCKLDRAPFAACSSPFKKRVGLGKHKFEVYAVDRAGNEDATPAKAKFKRVRR